MQTRFRLAALASFVLFAFPPVMAAPDDVALRHAHKLLKSTPLADGHNDLPMLVVEQQAAPRDVDAYDLNKKMPHETDIARMRQGHLSVQFWAAYVPGEPKSGWARMGMEQIELTHRLIARYPKDLAYATSSADIARAFKAGKIASLIGVEGGHTIENSLGVLRAQYMLGVRYLTLTHNVTLDWADAALGEARHKGLTPFGKEVVREMNRLGMLVDISHVSADVMRDALDTSVAPVMFSHSSARALANHPRNVPDDILARMPKNGGLVMVTFVPDFLTPEGAAWNLAKRKAMEGVADNPAAVAQAEKEFIAKAGPDPKATLAQVADHVEHIAKVAGKDHVGLAGDYGGAAVPVGLEDTSTYPALFAELIRRGWNDADLKKLAGQNLIRTMAQAEKVAARLQKERRPSTATIEQLDGKKP